MKPDDIQELKALIDFLKENQVAEFDLDRGDLKIRLKFNQAETAAGVQELARLLGNAQGHAPQAVSHAPAAAVVPVVQAAADPDAGLHLVKSPIVGTFYGSPSPGAAPFVGVGDRVAKGQIVCIIEAMKLMNEIESDAAGEIVKCFVTNGQPIEFGQPLYSVRPA
jgi:acetyl-CoA carboxylase biotin carboxyl carrier protein